MTQQSLAIRLSFCPADLLPFPEEAMWLAVGRESVRYTVSKRLYDALEVEALASGTSRARVFTELRQEINALQRTA